MGHVNVKLVVTFSAILLAASLFNIRAVSSIATLSIEPEIVYTPAGESFKVNVTVTGVDYLYDWQVNLTFNPSVLRCVNTTEGDFLARQPQGTYAWQRINQTRGWVFFGVTTIGVYQGESGSGTLGSVEFEVTESGESMLKIETEAYYIPATDTWVYPTILKAQTAPNAPPNFEDIEFNAENGLFINTVIPPVADFTYSPDVPGVGESITFNASASYAASPLEIIEYFWDFDDGTNATTATSTIEHSFDEGGVYTVSLTVFDNATATALVNEIFGTDVMPPIWYQLLSTKQLTIGISLPHDIAVLSVTPSRENAAAGDTISIEVEVANRGTETEDFSVTVYYGANAIGTQQVTGLASGEEETLTFSWSTSGVAAGEYQIKAVVPAVTGETHLQNNEYLDGTITITSSNGSFPTTLVIAGIAVAAVVVVLAIFLLRRRRSAPSTSAPPA